MIIAICNFILSIALVWSPQPPEGWYLCESNGMYDQYVENRDDCWYGPLLEKDQNVLHLRSGYSVVLVPTLGFVDCLFGPVTSADDACAFLYDRDLDGSVTLRDVAIWMNEQ